MNRVLVGVTTGLLLSSIGLVVAPWQPDAIATQPPGYLAQTASLQNSWQLVGWGKLDNLQRSLRGTEITADFQDGKLTGSAGCNRYMGSYSVEGSTLTTKGFGTTRKACPQPIMRQESAYLSALGGVTTYRITDQNQLQISYQTPENSGVLVYELLTANSDPVPLPAPIQPTPKPLPIEPSPAVPALW